MHSKPKFGAAETGRRLSRRGGLRSAAVALVMGTWALQQHAELPAAGTLAMLALVGGSLLLASRELRQPGLRVSALLLGVAALGFSWAGYRAVQQMGHTLEPSLAGRPLIVEGYVASLPTAIERGWRFEFVTRDTRLPKRLSLRWYSAPFGQSGRSSVSPVVPGERWQFTVKLAPPHGNLNRYGLDFEAWLFERGIAAVGTVVKKPPPLRLDPFVITPQTLIERVRYSVAKRFNRVLGERSGVLKALAIGDQSDIPAAQWEIFLRTGVNHLLSISGLHVTMLATLCGATVYAFWRRSPRLMQRLAARRAALAAGFMVACMYALLAGFSIPTQRTLYMLAAVVLALWSGRSVAPSQILAFALLIVVVLDPWAVLSPGFWLSFGAVGTLLYAAGRPLRRPGRFRQALHAQLAVSIALVPVLILLFQQISLIAPLANLVAVPLVSLVIVPLTLSAALLPLDTLLLTAQSLTSYLLVLLSWLDRWPFAVWTQAQIPPWAMLTGMLGVLLLLAPKGWPARWLGIVYCLPMLFYFPPRPGPGEMWVNVMDVGQGLAVHVQTARHALLYDTGPDYDGDGDAGARLIVPQLRGAGIGALDTLVISHNDLDHSGGAASLLRAVQARTILSSLPGDHALARQAQHRTCVRGQQWHWDGVKISVLGPARESYADTLIEDNDRSCVLRFDTASGSLLLPGDIERDAEAELVSSAGAALAATVVLVPHHGSRTSSTEAFLDAVVPRLSIVTAGYRNRYGHPKPDVLARYLERGSTVVRTDLDGAIELRFGQGRISIAKLRQIKRRYWHRNNGSTDSSAAAGRI